MGFGALLCQLEDSKSACFRDLRKQPHSGRSRPRAWEKQAVFTPVTRKGEGKRGSPSKASNFSTAPERERPAGRSCGQVEAEAQSEPAAAGEVGTAHTFPAGARVGEEGSVSSGRRRPRTRRGGGQSPSPEPSGPQSRHRPRTRSPRRRGRQVLLARARVGPVGWAGLGRVPAPCSPTRLEKRSGGAYLARSGRPRWAWLRGPGRNWLPGEGPASPTRSW